jgi:NAD-dependent SIR2 family protein deacetylase
VAEDFTPRQRTAENERMERPELCPECGSNEIHETTRTYSLHGTIEAFYCGACDWTSDHRIGRPPAARSKNVTLRRMLAGTPRGNRASAGTNAE